MSGVVNQLGSVSGLVGTTTGAGGFESGTKMFFNQTSSPTGWTKSTSANDVALRLVSGSVGTGGSVAFETALASHTPTISMSNAGTTLSYGQMPNVITKTQSLRYATTSYTGSSNDLNISTGDNVTYVSGASAHSHGNSSSSSAINLDVSYVDVILATKD